MDRARVAEDLRRFEGFRSRVYTCPAGKLTIGYGRNLEDTGISQEEAEHLLDHDITRAVDEIRQMLGFFDELDPVRQEVIVNMVFNMGLPRFMKFRKTLFFIEEGVKHEAAQEHQKAHECWIQASQEMLDSAWARQVGHRAQILARRMVTGVYEV